MNGQKSNIESGVSATKLMPIDITMTLHTIASDLRVMRAALAEGEAGPLVVSDVAYQLDRVQRQLDNFASEVHERGAAE
ncbi:MAG: hypothetical protein IH582_10690 [Afipia sp.]|nr:hypothetical protein [Afipia sp.]